MICSERELGLGDDHAGIIVLPEGTAEAGADASQILGVGDDVLDIAITPDRGYALSLRGIGREVAIAYGVDFHDPVDRPNLPRPRTTAPRGVPSTILTRARCSPCAPSQASIRIRRRRNGCAIASGIAACDRCRLRSTSPTT